MSRSAHRPAELVGVAFRGSAAVAEGLLTPDHLRAAAWVRLLHGIYAHRACAEQPGVRLQALALATKPGHVVCGRTAAWLHGTWQPRRGTVVPLEVCKPLLTTGIDAFGHSRRRLVLRGSDDDLRPCYGLSVLDDDVMELVDVRVTSPLRTCFDLMRERRLVESVVVADAFLYPGAVHPTHLAAYCADRRRWPGVREARVATSLSSAAARSPGETRLRMALVLGGFEEPLVNVPVLDEYGFHIGTPDLQVRGRTWAWLEYDGAYHDDVDQRAADLRRENRLSVSAAGVPILRYDRRHLYGDGPEAVLGEVTRATGARGVVALDPRDFWRPSAAHAW